jgi:hypothetical protein
MWHFARLASLALFVTNAAAQMPARYQLPPVDILALADAPAAPQVLSDSRNTILLLLAQDSYPPLAELSAPEMRWVACASIRGRM